MQMKRLKRKTSPKIRRQFPTKVCQQFFGVVFLTPKNKIDFKMGLCLVN
jgi:hypothetical protein